MYQVFQGICKVLAVVICSTALSTTVTIQVAAAQSGNFKSSNKASDSKSADSRSTDPAVEMKASLNQDSHTGTLSQVNFSPVTLRGGSQLNLVSPGQWSTLATELVGTLKSLHQRYSTMFGEIPPFTTTVRLMDEETFYLSTGAPRWTNAMYYKGQIIIPLSDESARDRENLIRSVKHEYTHAVINSLSGGRCPGWLDEGLAQWAEGSENPALQPALLDWLSDNEPVSLGLLQGGFTKLATKMVPAAYAQSLYAAHHVIDRFGFVKIGEYLENLRKGDDKRTAFQKSFLVQESIFERGLGSSLRQWQEHKRPATTH